MVYTCGFLLRLPPSSKEKKKEANSRHTETRTDALISFRGSLHASSGVRRKRRVKGSSATRNSNFSFWLVRLSALVLQPTALPPLPPLPGTYDDVARARPRLLISLLRSCIRVALLFPCLILPLLLYCIAAITFMRLDFSPCSPRLCAIDSTRPPPHRSTRLLPSSLITTRERRTSFFSQIRRSLALSL